MWLKDTAGDYTVRSAYNILLQQQQPADAAFRKDIWLNLVLPKVAALA